MLGQNDRPLDTWVKAMRGISRPKILLTGAKPWKATVNPDYESLVPDGKWVRTDIEQGDGVDWVVDLQRIDQECGREYDGILSPATLEHVDRPWLAMAAMSNILKPGGMLYLHSHQTFPIHGYPSDHFRFSDKAMGTMCYDAKLHVVLCEYNSPCSIVPPPDVTVWDPNAPAFLNITVFAIRGE